MPCYHPLKAFYRLSEDGKKDIAFCHSKAEAKRSTLFRNGILYKDVIDIPCGQCIGCRLEYSRQWAVRCVLESRQWNDNFFLTLTYDDDHLPSEVHSFVNEDTGEVEKDFLSHPLVPDDLKKFMKDLRRYFSYHFHHDNIRFFACGEYGDKNGRPHYHVILFNCPIPDLQSSMTMFSHSGFDFFESEILSKIWNKGLVGVGDLTFESCAYTARYIMKKHKGKDRNFYQENGLVPEFTRMSRKPGIGGTFFDDNMEKIYRYDSVMISNSRGDVITMKPPKYYDRLFDLVATDQFFMVRAHREDVAKASKCILSTRTSLDHDVYLTKLEDIKISQIDTLKRQIES